jgi:hypothetical protein
MTIVYVSKYCKVACCVCYVTVVAFGENLETFLHGVVGQMTQLGARSEDPQRVFTLAPLDPDPDHIHDSKRSGHVPGDEEATRREEGDGGRCACPEGMHGGSYT